MARPQFPKNAERLSGLNRRQLLASGAAAATAIATPDAACATAVSIQTPASSGLPATHFSDATARCLTEIARRNETRREAKLPLLSIPKELRRTKAQEGAEAFHRFEAEHSRAVWEQVLQSRREAEGNPNWRPG
jgi:hypothetical protein